MKYNYLFEIWRPIRDYEGLYEVSNFGRVRSIDHYCQIKSGALRKSKGVLLKQSIVNNYYVVSLQHRSFKVHRLVAFAFPEICGEYFECAVVNHKDENKLNNCAYNLEWCTVKYNNNYGFRNQKLSNSLKGRIFSNDTKEKMSKSAQKRGVKHLEKSVYAIDKNGIKKYFKSMATAEIEGYGKVSKISACCLKKYGRKTHNGYSWEFA